MVLCGGRGGGWRISQGMSRYFQNIKRLKQIFGHRQYGIAHILTNASSHHQAVAGVLLVKETTVSLWDTFSTEP